MTGTPVLGLYGRDRAAQVVSETGLRRLRLAVTAHDLAQAAEVRTETARTLAKVLGPDTVDAPGILLDFLRGVDEVIDVVFTEAFVNA